MIMTPDHWRLDKHIPLLMNVLRATRQVETMAQSMRILCSWTPQFNCLPSPRSSAIRVHNYSKESKTGSVLFSFHDFLSPDGINYLFPSSARQPIHNITRHNSATNHFIDHIIITPLPSHLFHTTAKG